MIFLKSVKSSMILKLWKQSIPENHLKLCTDIYFGKVFKFKPNCEIEPISIMIENDFSDTEIK